MTETLAEKDANGVAKKDVVSLLTSSMTIDINSNDFTASGGIVISKDKQKAQSGTAAYIEAEKKITLTGNVSIETSDGDTVKAEKAVIYTDKDTFEAEGERIEINFTV